MGVAAPYRLRLSSELAARFGLSALSQLLSSVTNLGLTVALAVSASTDGFGRIISVYSIYMLALTLSRALTTDALLADAGDQTTGSHWPWAFRRILLAGCLGAGAALVVGLIVGAGGVAPVILALSIPALLLQDGVRHLAWSSGQPRSAVATDGVWLVVALIVAGLLASVGGGLGLGAITFSWCFGGLASLFFGWRQIVKPVAVSGLGRHPSREALIRYRAMSYSQAMMGAAVNLGPVVVAVAISSTMAGVLKAAILPVAPVLSLFAGIRVVTLPALRAALQRGQAAGFISVAVSGSVLAAAAGAAASVWTVRMLPQDWIGESIGLVEPYLNWSVVICAMYVGGQQLADATALAGRHAVAGRRLVTIAAEWGCLIAGTAALGAHGLVVGWAIGVALSTAVWLWPALRP